MRSRSLLILGFVTAAVLASGATFLVAGHGDGHGKAGHDEMVATMFQHLDLDADQKEQAHEIMMKAQQKSGGTQQKMQAMHDQMLTLAFAEDYDERALRNAAQEFASAQVEMMMAHADVFRQLREILDAGQVAKLQQMMEAHFGAMGGEPHGAHGHGDCDHGHAQDGDVHDHDAHGHD